MQDRKEECFHFGREGERAYMAYSLRKNRTMIEVGALREKLGNNAPMIYLPEEYQGIDKLVSPDFLTVNAQAMLTGKFCPWTDQAFVWTAQNMWDYPFLWNEVKTKNGCTWSKILRCWQTGIDGYLLRHYRKVQLKTNIPVLLFFLQVDSTTVQKDIPKDAGCCPTGIYACPVMQKPDAAYSHRWGYGCSLEKAEMVYWSIDRLIYLAPLSEFRNVNTHPSKQDEQESLERAKTRSYYNPRGEM